ncbi:MAG TPA: response regulator transcription factor [Candidatus Limnocylindria bacterium]|nr:response regulator transcription factor [Candidatus Limnocylindria bacterium]
MKFDLSHVKVVLADDHGIVRDGLVAALKREANCTCCAAVPDGFAALEAVHLHRPDIVLLDHSMPGLGGIEVVARLRQEAFPVRALLLSSFSNSLLVAEALNAGADGFVTKEEPVSELCRGILATLAGECFLSSGIDRAGLRDSLNSLPPTPREREVLELLVQGQTMAQIARTLGLSARTIETHRNHLAAKFGAANLIDLVSRAVEAGFARSHRGENLG